MSLFLAGYAADRIGYKSIFLTAIVVFCAAGTGTDITPRFRSCENHPQVQLTSDWQLNSLIWPACNSDACDVNITTFLFDMRNCKDSDGNSIKSSTIVMPLNRPNWTTTVLPRNGTFCSMNFSARKTDITCDVVDDTVLASCVVSSGSHAVSLIVYCVFKILFTTANSVMYSLMDGVAVTYSKMFNGDYGKCIMFQGLAGLLGSFMGGYLIVDSDDPNGKPMKDKQKPFQKR